MQSTLRNKYLSRKCPFRGYNKHALARTHEAHRHCHFIVPLLSHCTPNILYISHLIHIVPRNCAPSRYAFPAWTTQWCSPWQTVQTPCPSQRRATGESSDLRRQASFDHNCPFVLYQYGAPEAGRGRGDKNMLYSSHSKILDYWQYFSKGF